MSETRRPLTFEDFWRLRHVFDVQASPDGRTVAYVVQVPHEEDNAFHSAIWLADVETGGAQRFTSGEAADSQPRWSPDGSRLAFVSTRSGGKPQIFIIDVHGGEPERVTSALHGATTPVWSPDGRRLCYSSALPTETQSVTKETDWLDRHPKAAETAKRMRLQSSLQSRADGRGYVDHRIHLFLVDLTESQGKPTQLTEGEYDAVGPAWSPDGRSVAFAANRGEDREYSMGIDLWTLDVQSGECTVLTSGGLAALAPAWSPDSSYIAFYGAIDAPGCGYQQLHLYVVPRNGGKARDLTAGLDRGCGIGPLPDYMYPQPAAPAWSPDGRGISFIVADRGDGAIYEAEVETGTVRRLSGAGSNAASVQYAGERPLLTGLAATPTHPFDVYVIPSEGGKPRFPFDTHSDFLAEIDLVPPQRLTWQGPDGWEIEGWLMRPTTPNGAPYPLILDVHGGPHGMYGNTFYLQKQVLAGAGYGVLFTNPRGSGGYGLDFGAAADWGQKDYEDIMAGLEAVLAQGEADPQRLGITGISYGGFMTDWVIGHTNRFAGAVAVNGVSNFVSFYSIADIGPLWFEREFPESFGGAFWKDATTLQRYIERSPLTYVDRVETPLLLIQSENDYRCPIDQGEGMLTALRARGKTVQLVRVPDASHVIFATAAPHHRYLQWVVLNDWFDTHVRDRQL